MFAKSKYNIIKTIVLVVVLIIIMSLSMLILGGYRQTWDCGVNGNTNSVRATLKFGTLTVYGVGSMESYNYNDMPWNRYRKSIKRVIIEGNVTLIGDYAFAGCTKLKSVIIGDSVMGIAKNAFDGCIGLKSVTFGVNLTSIGNNAFQGCYNLASITISENVTSIGDYAFSGTGLKYINIPNRVTFVGDGAFSRCYELMSISIGSNVSIIDGFDLFSYYPDRMHRNLISINIDKDNPVYSSVDGILFDKDQSILIRYPQGRHGAYTIPDNVIFVGDKAFSYCTGLTSIDIPNSVMNIGLSAFRGTNLASIEIPSSITTIGHAAFAELNRLKTITIPSNVTSIGNGTFDECPNLTNIYVESNNSTYISDEGVLFNINKTSIIRYPEGRHGTYVIPNSVKDIEVGAFKNCRNLTSVMFGNNVAIIGHSAFSRCTGLSSVIIGNSVVSIGTSAFRECSNLTSITIPSSVTSIGHGAFAGCRSLTSITIPISVTSIGEQAFADCYDLRAIIVQNQIPANIDTDFSGANKSRVCLYVPEVSIEAYLVAYGWEKHGWNGFKCIKPLPIKEMESK